METPLRRTTHHLHVTTSATATGMGKRLAGSGGSELWMPSSTPWDASSTASGSVQQQLVLPSASAAAVATEMVRAQCVLALRAKFRTMCELPAPPLNALERWLLLNKWYEPQSDEPLLPMGKAATPADAVLSADLRRAGMEAETAEALVKKLRRTARKMAAALRTSDHRGTCSPCVLQTAASSGVMRLSCAPPAEGSGASCDAEALGGDSATSVLVTTACIDKLRALHARAWPASAEDDDDVMRRVYCCLLRYQCVGGLGFQAAIGAPVFRCLQARFGCNFEAFASPLNCFYGAFCSAFSDVDGPFGSRGSFGDFTPTSGAYQCNPPFVVAIIDAMSEHLLTLLTAAEGACRSLSFVVVLPGWTDCAGYNRLLNAAPLLRRTLLVAAADHGFVDGGQHARPRTHRESPYDTMVFVLQSSAAAATWPASDAAIAELEAAFASCTPSETELASVDSTERVHRHGAVRKRKRRKMKRAGKKTRGEWS